MAQDIRVTAVGGSEMDVATSSRAGAGTTPNDPEEARSEIERTRARMSETIDEIEGALLRKKERIEDRLDLTAPVRERPMRALGIALGAGLVLGILTGGSDEDEEDEDGLSARERAEMWEHRAHRLLRIAREQEDELEALHGRFRAPTLRLDHRGDHGRDEPEEEGRSMFGRARDGAMDHAAGLVSSYVEQMVHRLIGR